MVHDKDKFLQNLKDADCKPDLISEFMRLDADNDKTEILKLLSGHRKTLLDNLHMRQKQLDCLDYLIYSIEHEV